MSEIDVATYYYNLPKWDKGRFAAYIGKRLGGSSHSWQAKFLAIYRGKSHRPIGPVSLDWMKVVIEGESWRPQQVD